MHQIIFRIEEEHNIKLTSYKRFRLRDWIGITFQVFAPIGICWREDWMCAHKSIVPLLQKARSISNINRWIRGSSANWSATMLASQRKPLQCFKGWKSFNEHEILAWCHCHIVLCIQWCDSCFDNRPIIYNVHNYKILCMIHLHE